ncbi:Cu-Zn family superoxide dismutase [Tamaricihabitans halophyticus]|uniref:Cu-Zn family superoxide dismutase n=1 Tax=Tamaricihabitans halophyticus TaxID=1262583 RepID=A0A4V2SV30_9PSEU|nr:superoxide dismutase family protein [Tamaricihabitans halophyticus]TCP56756.1 Cu-Zn family superoxide dismutase [Tamaricihabitans halophyticus]
MRRTTVRGKSTSRTLLALAAAGLLLTACGNDEEGNGQAQNNQQGDQTATTQQDDNDDQQGQPDVEQSGRLAPPESANGAFTYNTELAPEGAEVSVEAEQTRNGTKIEIDVEGLVANRGYAVHAHTEKCGDDGDAAGPHFQNEVDPAATKDEPSTDPKYANPENEVWLDLRTDGEGEGDAETEVPFKFTDRAPASIVIHENEETATHHGEAGTAGDRVACLTVPFA